MPQSEGNIVKNFYAVNGFGKILNHKNLVSDFAVWTEINVRVFTAGRTHIVKLDFFQGTLTGSCLLGLGSVGAETGNKFLQLFDLFFFFLIGFFHLFDKELAGFEPEIVVTCVKLDFAVVNICCVGADLIQEVTVVGYHNYGVVKVN